MAPERERIAQERKQNYELSLKFIEDFTNLIYARRTKAAMLQSSLKRKETKEQLIKRKQDYDAAFSEWNSKLQTTLFGIRRITESSTYSYFESLVETELRRPFALLDTCLTDIYDFSIKIKAKRQYRKCDIDSLLKVALDCSYAMSDELYKFVIIDRQKPTSDRQGRIRTASLEISRRCDVSNIVVEMDAPQAARHLP
jgi:hypothetical protein